MRKILTILAGLLFLVSLSSCINLNKEMNFTQNYTYAVKLQDKDAEKEVVDFIESYFMNGSKRPSYFGKIHDVTEKAGLYFQECVTAPEVTNYFSSCIQDEKDYIVLESYISSEHGDCWVGTWSWQWSNKDQRMVN
jgi:hypothetical protein